MANESDPRFALALIASVRADGGEVAVSFPKPEKRRRDAKFLAWIHRQPCLLAGVCYAAKRGHIYDACEGIWKGSKPQGVEADHAGRRGMSRKSHDDESLPFCPKHHRDRTELTGFFSPDRMSREERRAWLDERIAETQRRYAEALADDFLEGL